MNKRLPSTITLSVSAHVISAFAGMTVLLAGTAYAANNDACNNSVFSPDGDLCVSITAHRLEQPLKNVGSSTTVVTREEMERRGIRNVSDALKRVPGAALARTGGYGSTTNIRLRGSDSGQVRVLIDGVTVNDPTNTENFFDFSTLQTNDIERIEVIRGPQSSLWGADTTGGVINIITRKHISGSETSGFAETGSNQTYRGGLSHYGTVEKISYGASIQHDTTKGYSRNAATRAEKDGARSTDMKGNLGIALLDNLSFDVAGGITDAKAEFDPSSTIDGPAHQDSLQYYGSAKATLKNFDDKLQQSIKASHFTVDRDLDEPLGFFRYSSFVGKRNQLTYQADLALRARDVATVGLDWQGDSASTSNTRLGITSAGINTDINNKAVFAQYILGLTEDWTVSLGGRSDDHSSFGRHHTYRATTAYHIPQTGTTLRGTYGTGFKAPSQFQLFAANFGNPNLKPEESKAFDIGVEQRLVDGRLVLSSTAFQSKVKNLIAFTTGYQNVNRATVQGVESSASFAITPTVLVSGNHTWLNSEDESTHRSLPRRPKHVARAALDVDVTERARVGSELLYTSSQWDRATGLLRVHPHTTVNLNGSFDINDNIEIYSDLENIFNKDYQEIVGFQAPGFEAYVGVRARY